MNKEEKMQLLKGYISANVAPILLEGISSKAFEDVVLLPANISSALLNGHYENERFVCPTWYELVKHKENASVNLLLIDDITTISKEEQLKYIELLKYRKIGDFKLPDNCVIIMLASKVNKELISENIYNLVAHI